MDAQSKANYINSIASGQKKPCPTCNTLNDMDAQFCYLCGKELLAQAAPKVQLQTKPVPQAQAVLKAPSQATPVSQTSMQEVPKAQPQVKPVLQASTQEAPQAKPISRASMQEAPKAQSQAQAFPQAPAQEALKAQVFPQASAKEAPKVQNALKKALDAASHPVEEDVLPFTATMESHLQQTLDTESEGNKVAKKESDNETVFASVPVAATSEMEEISVFAQGLPAWDIVPPQIMVRRKKKK